MGSYLAVVQALVLLYFVSVVIECAVHQKRDVHHRIIIKEKRPRRVARPSNKEHHHHHQPRHSHKKERKHKHHKDSVEQASYEEGSDERYSEKYSPESSYEEVYKKRKNSSKRHKHRSHSHKPQNSYRDDSRESKYQPFKEDSSSKYRNEWRPISSETSVLMDQIFRENKQHPKYKKPKKEKKFFGGRHNTNEVMRNLGYLPYEIDMTTVYPSFGSYQFDSTIYPPLSAFPTYNQKVFETIQPPLIGTIEQFSKPDYAELEATSKKLVAPRPVNSAIFAEQQKAVNPYEVHEAPSEIVEVKVKATEAVTAVPVVKKEEAKSEPKKDPPNSERSPQIRGRYRMRIKPKQMKV